MSATIVLMAEAKTDCPTEELNKLHGLQDQQDFTDYISGGDFPGITFESGSYMEFRVLQDSKVCVFVKYNTNKELSETEIQSLVKYTQGQWSDGIGEGFEQFPCAYTEDGEEIYVSPWFRGQKVMVGKTFNFDLETFKKK